MRSDLSDSLIHLVKGQSWEEGLETLKSIIIQRRLIAGDGMIKGGFRCTCFSEAPVAVIAQQFLGDAGNWRYLPFGVIIPKLWLFERGGRPVIYQTDSEYHDLPQHLRWRHVRYEPNSSAPVDFTWEREWRLQCDELLLEQNSCRFLFPTAEWYHRFTAFWHHEQSSYSHHLTQAIGQAGWLYYEDFDWAREALELYLNPI